MPDGLLEIEVDLLSGVYKASDAALGRLLRGEQRAALVALPTLKQQGTDQKMLCRVTGKKA